MTLLVNKVIKYFLSQLHFMFALSTYAIYENLIGTRSLLTFWYLCLVPREEIFKWHSYTRKHMFHHSDSKFYAVLLWLFCFVLPVTKKGIFVWLLPCFTESYIRHASFIQPKIWHTLWLLKPSSLLIHNIILLWNSKRWHGH